MQHGLAKATMSAETIAKALGGRKIGAFWMAQCPAHNDREPSLAIRDADANKVLVHCHAGCDQDRVIMALRVRGLWTENTPRSNFNRPPPAVTRIPDQDDAKRSANALGIWNSAQPANGTLVETYLASRHIHTPVPAPLRFHARLKHRSGGKWPAMVALVTRGSDGAPLAVHRTFLAHDGASKAQVDQAKMMLGPCSGGAVRLGEPCEILMVGEGIETCLAAMQATGHPAWAALSTSGMRALDLPDAVREVIVLADGDDPGEAAALASAMRWTREGRRVRIARPPKGMDFNDLLVRGARGSEEGL